MSFSQDFSHNEAQHETQLPLHSLLFVGNSALPQSEGDQMTPRLLNLVHVAVRNRFEGAQTYGHTRIYVNIR